MGERVNKVKEMIDEHEASLKNLKESTKQYDEQINQYEIENKQKALHIERLVEEREAYAKDDRMLLEEYNKSIEQTEKEQAENIKKKQELEVKKQSIEKDVKEQMESFTRYDSILRKLTQEEMQIDTDISKIQLDMQTNLYKQKTFKIEYDQDGNPTNGMELSKLDKEYKDLTDQLRDLKAAKALCREYIQKCHDELDNDAKRKFGKEMPEPKSTEQEQQAPAQQAPAQQAPAQQAPAQQAPAQQAPAQQAPAQQAPAQQAPAQQAPAQQAPAQQAPAQQAPAQQAPAQQAPAQQAPAQQAPAQQKKVDLNTFAKKIYDSMTPKLRNDIYMFTTGQSQELNENAKQIFDRVNELYGENVANKIESRIKQLSAKECLKVTEIKTDVTTGKITIDFNCGKDSKPIEIDLTEGKYNRRGAQMESIKATKKKIDSTLQYDETISDPYVMVALDKATRKQLAKFGLSENDIDLADIQKQVDSYQKALETPKDAEDKKIDMNISYVKSDEDKPIKAGRKKFEKVLMPAMRVAKESAYVNIDDSIDTRTATEKFKDAVSAPWRWLTEKIKPLPEGRKNSQETRNQEDELENVGRVLGPNAQINMVKNMPTGEVKNPLKPEEEKAVNEALRDYAEKQSNSQNNTQQNQAASKDSSDRDDR